MTLTKEFIVFLCEPKNWNGNVVSRPMLGHRLCVFFQDAVMTISRLNAGRLHLEDMRVVLNAATIQKIGDVSIKVDIVRNEDLPDGTGLILHNSLTMEAFDSKKGFLFEKIGAP